MERIRIDKGYYGAIEKYSPKAYQLVGGELNIEDITENKDNFWKYHIEYNQYYINNSGCTIFAGDGIVSNYFDYPFSKNEILEQIELAKKKNPPFIDGKGWRIYMAVDLVRNWRNKLHPENILITYEIETGGELFWELLKKGYHIQTGFYGDRAFTADKKDNCKIDRVEKVENPTYGHSIYFGLKDGKLYTIDSYKDFGCNVYEVVNFEKLLKNGAYFKHSYVYIPKKNIMNQLQKDIAMVEKALKCGITHNKKELEDIKKGKYTQDNRTTIKIMRAKEMECR